MGKKKLYALLVGIDDYPLPVSKLSGCVNDIEEVEKLVGELSQDGRFDPSVLTLKDAQSTRAAIVDGFRKHLSKAGPGDAALFYYCGHGSQAAAPSELWSIEPDRLNETLVCYDSRQQGGWDLADKELALLVAEVAQSGTHLVCILDCCHSGSGTREGIDDGLVERRAATDLRARPLASFLDGQFARQCVTDPQLSPSGWITLPAGRHVLLAACRSDETAKEIKESGRSHGAFTAALLTALREYGGEITYRDLLKRAEAQVRMNVLRQVPQIEANHQEDVWRVFLGDAGKGPQPYFTLRFDKALQWVIDAGAINGIAPPRANDVASFAIFDLKADFGLAYASDALATVLVKQVQPSLSVVDIASKKAELHPLKTYRAVLTTAPPAPMLVAVTGDAQAVTTLCTLMKADGNAHMVTPATESVPADFSVTYQNNSYRIRRSGSDVPVVADVVGVLDEAAKETLERLEHIARWQSVKNLRNPFTRLGAQPIQIVVLVPKLTDKGEIWVEADARNGALTVEYTRGGADFVPPRMRVKLRNTGTKELYCALLYLQDDFSVLTDLLSVAERVPPGGDLAAYKDQEFAATVPDLLWKAGRTRTNDMFKVLASTEQFDAGSFAQPALQRFTESKQERGLDNTLRNARELLLARTRALELNVSPPDWTTAELTLTVSRPLQDAPIPQSGASADLGAGVKVLGHSSLRAKASLAPLGEAGRALGVLSVPSIFRDDPRSSEPFMFEATRDADAGLGVLVLQDVENPEAVGRDAPLVLEFPASLGSDEHVIAYAWDGQFHIPLGVARRGKGESTVPLTLLPKPLSVASDVERGIANSIRILFHKVVSKYLPIGYDYPRLSSISYGPNEETTYESAPEIVRDKVARASNILLFVHGILGDTFGMTASAASGAVRADGSLRRLTDTFDLVLAFDYENIETDLEETARALKSRLAAVGLGPDHGKKLTVAAHSMGGLVSRWFIEREGGNRVIGRLVTLGTPHAGSPWSVIEDWAMTTLAIGLNGLSQVAWPVRILGAIAGCIERVDVTLDQMSPKSVFIANLRESADPSIPYTLLIGNTSIIATPAADNLVKDLLQRLSPGRLTQIATSLAFLNAPNDIAVAVTSAGAVPTDRNPVPLMAEVACDHVSFFISEAGRRALVEALDKA